MSTNDCLVNMNGEAQTVEAKNDFFTTTLRSNFNVCFHSHVIVLRPPIQKHGTLLKKKFTVELQ